MTAAILFWPKRCTDCGAWVERARRCYVIPVCYACLPPPRLLRLASLKGLAR